MKKILLLVAGVVLVAPFFVSAQTAPVTDQFVQAQNSCIDLHYNMGYRSRDAKTNGEVSDLQDFLNTNGYLSVEPTGYFGAATTDAIKKFQIAVGLGTATTPGIGGAGPLTRAKIKEISCAGAPSNTGSLPTPQTTAAVITPVTFSGSTVSVVPGCFAGYKFSATTGRSCSAPVPTAVPGCFAGYAFSATTGQSCSANVIPLCNSEQTLINGVCHVITVPYACPNGTVIQVAGMSSPENKANQCPAATSPTPTVEFLGAPTLNLIYSAGKEVELVGTAKVKITAGANKISFNAPNGGPGQLIKIVDSNGNDPQVHYEVGSISGGYSGTATLQANTSVTYDIKYSVSPKQLFAGVYMVTPIDFYDINGVLVLARRSYKYSGSVNSSPVTIVGETSPYITSIVADPSNTYISASGVINTGVSISGVRFDPASNVINMGGITITVPSSNNGTLIRFVPAAWGVTPGSYPVQVTSPTTGASNRFYAYLDVPTSPTPTVEFVGTPTLTLQYDSANREANLVGSATVKITAGNTSVSTIYVPYVLKFWKQGLGVVSSNSMTANMAGGPTQSLGANTSATFTLAYSVPAKELFAGAYYLGLSDFSYLDASGAFQTLPFTSFKNAWGSNAITIIGETSPYITGITSNQLSNSTFTITGNRFASTGNIVSVGGILINTPSTSNGTLITFTPEVAGIPAGMYPVQVTSPTTGASNIMYTNITAPVTPTTVVAPTLTLAADKTTLPYGPWLGNVTDGTSANLSWTSTNATSCTTSGFNLVSNSNNGTAGYTYLGIITYSGLPGEVRVSGISADGSTVTPNTSGAAYVFSTVAQTMTYRITCTGSGGSTSKSVAVTWAPVSTTVMGPSTAIAFGVYSGGAVASTNHQEQAVSVTIPSTATGKTLVLTAYEPVNWVISNPSNVVIKNIIAIGFYSQRLTGAVPSVPTEYDSNLTNGVYQFAYQSTDAYFTALVSWLAGKQITLSASNFKGSYSAAALALSATTSGQSQLASVIGAFAPAPVSTSAPAWAYTWTRNLEVNSPYADDVSALQTALTKEGVYSGEVTGGFHAQTYLGVKAFQAKYGIDSTGFVGPITLAKLNELYK